MGVIKAFTRKAKSPVKAIRLMCLECMGMSRTENNPARPFKDVDECSATDCPLHSFRLGKNPFHGKKKKVSNSAQFSERKALVRA